MRSRRSIGERERHSRRCREPGAGRQAAQDIAALPRRCNASSTTRTAACGTTRSANSSVTISCCSRAANSPLKKVNSCRPRLRAVAAKDLAFLFFTSGTTGPAKGVVLTHASLIDRARVAASMGELKDTDVAMAYLPPGWIGQNLFGYVQPMVVGYCICCPNSSPTPCLPICARWVRPISSPHRASSRRWPSRYRSESRRWGGFNQRLYRHCMAAGGRVASRTLAGEPLSVGDRLASIASDLVMRGPLRDVLGMSSVRVAYTAGGCSRSRSPHVFSRPRN